MSGIPFEEVRALDAVTVAHMLGLEKARKAGKNKYACPRCASSDACDVFPNIGARVGRGAYCWSCQTAFSVIDMAMELWGVDHVEATKQLASMYGIQHEDVPKFVAEKRRAIRRKPRAEVVLDRDVTKEPLWELLLGTRLGPRGRSCLKARGLDLEMCAHYGVRSIESPEEYDALVEGWHPDELRAAGLLVESRRKPGTHVPHPGWAVPVLVIPYLTSARTTHPEHGEIPVLDTLRFRQLDQRHGPKYLSLAGPMGTPDVPFLSESIGLALANDMTLIICEGELNALSCLQAGFPAISGCGAGSWRREWCDGLGDVRKVVVVCDGDEAGRKFGESVAGHLLDVYGPRWFGERFGDMVLGVGEDANDLLQAGRLRSCLSGVV